MATILSRPQCVNGAFFPNNAMLDATWILFCQTTTTIIAVNANLCRNSYFIFNLLYLDMGVDIK